MRADIDTAACATCATFVETKELLFAPDGSLHCIGCGVPPAPPADSAFANAFEPGRSALLARLDSLVPEHRGAAAVALGVCVTVLLFWLAAGASQI